MLLIASLNYLEETESEIFVASSPTTFDFLRLKCGISDRNCYSGF